MTAGSPSLVEMKDAKVTVLNRIKCVYMRGGVCVEHGEGARKHYKPVVTRETSPGGGVTVKKTRKMFYVCDLELSGRRRLTQSRLSFGNTPERPSGNKDTDQDLLNISGTSKVGQNRNSGDVRNEMVDEK